MSLRGSLLAESGLHYVALLYYNMCIIGQKSTKKEICDDVVNMWHMNCDVVTCKTQECRTSCFFADCLISVFQACLTCMFGEASH